jgi:glucokinase
MNGAELHKQKTFVFSAKRFEKQGKRIMQAVGIDLGGTNLKAALVDKELGILEQISLPTEAHLGPVHVLDQIGKAVNQLKEVAAVPPVGVGIGSPGTISLDRKTVSYPPNFPGWTEINVHDEIVHRSGLKCLVENDANVAALGSSRFGVGKGFPYMVMVTLGTGVGGGIIINGELYRGATGAAGEMGHVSIDYNGPHSNSPAQGGIEAYLGQRFLSRHAATMLAASPENPLTLRFTGKWEEMEPVHLFEEAEKGNELAIQVFRWAGEKLGYAIVNYVHLLDIRKIVVSGGVARAGKYILEPAREAALSRLMKSFHKDFEITFEPLGNNAALLGAASLALEFLA